MLSLKGVFGVDASFDYVVVGAGTSGLTVAARLAEQQLSVALIEAGDYYETIWPLAMIPGAVIIGLGSSPLDTTPIDWNFVTAPIPGANNRKVHYARHKALGGCSVCNVMIYQRPDNGSLQRWADLVDDQSYTFDQLLPFYQRTPTFHPPQNERRPPNASAQYNPAAYSPAGEPLQVSFPIDSIPFSTWMVRGMQKIGINPTQDFSSGNLLGAQWCPFTVRPSDRTRSSSEAAFVGSSADRLATLTLYKTTMAKRILFNRDKKATGVVVRTGQSHYTLHARHEVIVSAGAFQSPQLLMVSGIGPSAALTAHNISQLVDLPGVGQNMWEHLLFGPSYRVKLITGTKIANNYAFAAEELARYFSLHRGLFTNPGADYLAWEKIPAPLRQRFSAATQQILSWFPPSWPEAEYISFHLYVGDLSSPFFDQPKDGFMYASMIGSLVAPSSRGSITLASADTDTLPIVQPNWLATESDAQLAVAIYRRIREAWHSDGMAPIVIGEEYFPGPSVQTDEEILAVIRQTVMTIFHAACTCKMGTRTDRMAVVDHRARVFGTRGLRVVDASAFAILPPGHPQATCYMLAEKIAADIIQGHGDGSGDDDGDDDGDGDKGGEEQRP
ncbi:GMC family oxidoreductase [Aspergillus saccharolyticus JOP 1030-1]|uniref:GMC oxidoreductase n=1 Tax=Aspergillus saccharolyticus JOP 1030-1 TaxID=1450539 RepID=A0A318ZEG9_9EURO|nr:GMC oxidoreductase [Aspergillus saccharolyticus JOP 1030-1]PYH44664.1 GMC oxidoreductase [Aspergillus saccharolyticus JOP 1030-1]